jgi:hypothetical protein
MVGNRLSELSRRVGALEIAPLLTEDGTKPVRFRFEVAAETGILVRSKKAPGLRPKERPGCYSSPGRISNL